MQKFNFHTHTFRCGHTEYGMSDEDFVRELIKKGFRKMAFTDHCPQKNQIDTRLYMRMDYSQAKEYLESIRTLKEKFKDEIQIESGFEIEYLPELENELFELKSISDKLILGQHFVYNKDKSNLKVLGVSTFDKEDLLNYANNIKIAMEKSLPDIVAHPDLFMLSSRTFGDAERQATEIICQTAEKTGIPLEINLGRVANIVDCPQRYVEYPCREFWEIASNYKINVLYGIDAHTRHQIRVCDKSIKIANEIIGKKTIKKLNFLTDCKETVWIGRK